MGKLRFAFAGDRDISVWCLQFLLSQRIRPKALLVTESGKASHDDALISLCHFLEPEKILRGKQFRQPEGLSLLRNLDLDYIICVHFPYIVPQKVLELPQYGALNLHPAFLPFNRGWHTPSWAILDGTPVGATLHFMDEGIDTGDIIHQKQLLVSPGDTANSLYKKLKSLELDIFKEAWPQLESKTYRRQGQMPHQGTVHKRAELMSEAIQCIDLNQSMPAGDLVRRLRALTTNRTDEAAYYEAEGKRYRIQVEITEENGKP